MPNDSTDRTPDPVAELVRLAGESPAIPADREARARAVVREQWKATVATRAARRRGGLALAVAASLLVVVGVLFWRTPTAPTTAAAEVASLARASWRQPPGPAGRAKPLRLGDPVAAGDDVTTDRDGRASLRLASGKSLRLDVDTRIHVVSASSIRLERGAIYVDSDPALAATPEPIEILTRWGSIRDIGTQFEVRMLEAALQVRVREGLVVLEADSGPRTVPAGRELRIGPGAALSETEIARSGQAWDWIGEITPMIELEGRSARGFLDWVARERGLTLEFADESVEDAATTTRLSGSIEGVGLADALDVVLPTCRMTHRVIGDRLIVEGVGGA